MHKQKTQTGFAHLLIITIILAVGLIGTLGYVYYQNFIAKKTDDTSSNTSGANKNKSPDDTTPTVTVQYKTFNSNKYGISFKYPDNWSLTSHKTSDNHGLYTESVDVENKKGETIASFITGLNGLGGTCDNSSTYSVLAAEPTSLKASKPVSFSYSAIQDEKGGYDAFFGLSDYFTSIVDGKACANTSYYVFAPNIDDSQMRFEARKHFSSLDSAKTYMNSDEYKAIKKMILSLNY